MQVVPNAYPEAGDAVAADNRGWVSRSISTEILDRNADSRPSHNIVDYAQPCVIRNSDSLAKIAKDVIDQVVSDQTVIILGAALTIRGQPDSDLSNVLNYIIAYDGIGISCFGSVNAEFRIDILSVVERAGS